MPEEIDLSPEEEEALDRASAKLDARAKLEELGEGPPRWGMDRARYEQPALSESDLAEWVRIANEEYRRLRIEKQPGSVADKLSIALANERFSSKGEV